MHRICTKLNGAYLSWRNSPTKPLQRVEGQCNCFKSLAYTQLTFISDCAPSAPRGQVFFFLNWFDFIDNRIITPSDKVLSFSLFMSCALVYKPSLWTTALGWNSWLVRRFQSHENVGTRACMVGCKMKCLFYALWAHMWGLKAYPYYWNQGK